VPDPPPFQQDGAVGLEGRLVNRDVDLEDAERGAGHDLPVDCLSERGYLCVVESCVCV